MSKVKDTLTRLQAEQIKGITPLLASGNRQAALEFLQSHMRRTLREVSKHYAGKADVEQIEIKLVDNGGRDQMSVKPTTEDAKQFLAWLQEQSK